LTWSGLGYLEGQTVSIVADGVIQDAQTVVSGAVTLAQPATDVQIGLPFTHIIEPLPPSAVDGGGVGRAVRLSRAVFRIEDTAALRLDTGRGLRDVPLRKLDGDALLDAPPVPVSGDIHIGALGWRDRTDQPLWRIEQDAPLSFTLLSVITELVVNG
jgi:hypothetical protein